MESGLRAAEKWRGYAFGMDATNHIAPRPVVSRLAGAPLISVAALAGIPDFVRNAFGQQVLATAVDAAKLDLELIEDSDCFIPQRTMTAFVDSVARSIGEEHLGLQLAPHLTVAAYGLWGEYLLGAETLGAAVRRAVATMSFHARGDFMALDVTGNEACIGYVSGARELDGYAHIAWGTVGGIVDLCRSYLSAAWRPLRIEVDLPAPQPRAMHDEAFGCPVIFGAPRLAVCLDAGALLAGGRRSEGRWVTAGDLARARSDIHRIGGLHGVVAHQVWAQIHAGSVSIESTAGSLDTSVRTLQRDLGREGTDFRTLVNALRSRRAVELLRETQASITQISTMLGYSAPAHFSRAFRKAVGLGPVEYRRALSGDGLLVPPEN